MSAIHLVQPRHTRSPTCIPTSQTVSSLTGFSMSSSFVPTFAAGANFQLANLNQPSRFGNATGADVQSALSMIAEPLTDYLTGVDLA